MKDVVHYNGLYDLYRDCLTDRQKSVFEDYFFENLTLDEIALFDGVSKSSVAKTLKQTKEILEDYERRLHFYEYMRAIKDEFVEEEDILNRIAKYDNMVL